MPKDILTEWVHEALRKLGGRGSLVDVARQIWQVHEPELRRAGDLFYTWQYDYRWSATQLRQDGKMKDEKESPKGVWELTDTGRR